MAKRKRGVDEENDELEKNKKKKLKKSSSKQELTDETEEKNKTKKNKRNSISSPSNSDKKKKKDKKQKHKKSKVELESEGEDEEKKEEDGDEEEKVEEKSPKKKKKKKNIEEEKEIEKSKKKENKKENKKDNRKEETSKESPKKLKEKVKEKEKVKGVKVVEAEVENAPQPFKITEKITPKKKSAKEITTTSVNKNNKEKNNNKDNQNTAENKKKTVVNNNENKNEKNTPNKTNNKKKINENDQQKKKKNKEKENKKDEEEEEENEKEVPELDEREERILESLFGVDKVKKKTNRGKPTQPSKATSRRLTKNNNTENPGAPVLVMGRYTAEEDNILVKSIEDYLLFQKPNLEKEELETAKQSLVSTKAKDFQNSWADIKLMCPLNRSTSSIYYRARRLIRNVESGEWDDEEISELKLLVKQYGTRWAKISEILGRLDVSVRDKYREINEDNEPKKGGGMWTDEENKLFYSLIEKNRMGNYIPWKAISLQMKSRTAFQCRSHYHYGSPLTFTGSQWSYDDDKTILTRIYDNGYEDEQEIYWPHVVVNTKFDVVQSKLRFQQLSKYAPKTYTNGEEISFDERVQTLLKLLTPPIPDHDDIE